MYITGNECGRFGEGAVPKDVGRVYGALFKEAFLTLIDCNIAILAQLYYFVKHSHNLHESYDGETSVYCEHEYTHEKRTVGFRNCGNDGFGWNSELDGTEYGVTGGSLE